MIVEDQFVVANESAASILGYDSIESLVNTHPSVLSPEFQADGQPSFEKANEMMTIAFREGYHRFDWIHQKRDGDNFPVEVTLTKVPYQGKEALFCVWRDMSEQKLLQNQLEEAKSQLEQKIIERTTKLYENQEQLKQAQKIAHLGSWTFDVANNSLQCSDETCRIFEADPDSFKKTYEAFLDLIHPADRELVNLAYTDSLRTKQPYDLVHRLLMADGRIKYVRVRCETEYDNQDKPVLSSGTLQDITDKEVLRIRLKNEEEQYHSLVTNIPAIVYRCRLDEDWTMQYMSNFTEDLTGYPVSDFLYNRVRSYASIIHPDDIQYVENAVDQGVKTDGRYFIEYRVIDKNEQTRWVFEKGQVVRTEVGEVDFLDGFIMDISERKHVEEVLEVKQELIESIYALQSRFIIHPDPFNICRDLLEDLKKLTNSEYGFVGEVYNSAEGTPYLTAYALSMLAWNSETKALYETAQKQGFEFHKLDNLFGHAITDREVIICNDLTSDPRSIGIPEGHPPIHNFLGIPVFYGEKLVGMVGLANHPSGYNQALIEYITPLISAYGQIIVARQAQEARDAAEATLAKLAHLDGLLSIPNRRSFDEYLEKQWRQARRGHEPLSMIMIDIDHFKFYNDTYGHQQGDDCLIQVSKTIQACLKRPADFVARYGGEEFVCVLPDTPLAGAQSLAEEIRCKITEQQIPHDSSPVAEYVTLSLGVAALTPSLATTPEMLISLADKALYQAKSNGRNQVVTSRKNKHNECQESKAPSE